MSFTVLSSELQRVNCFRIDGRKITVRVNTPPQYKNMLEWIELAMRDIHEYLLTLVASMNDRVGISISSNHFAHGSAGLSFRPANALRVDDLWGLVEGLDFVSYF